MQAKPENLEVGKILESKKEKTINNFASPGVQNPKIHNITEAIVVNKRLITKNAYSSLGRAEIKYCKKMIINIKKKETAKCLFLILPK
ncbi:MAG: hypothetical protein ACQESF_00085 [Nanobdellota archaeon]